MPSCDCSILPGVNPNLKNETTETIDKWKKFLYENIIFVMEVNLLKAYQIDYVFKGNSYK